MERYENVRKQGFYQKFFVCELLKNEGNGHYNRHQPMKALEAYLRALSIFLKRCPLNQGGSNNDLNGHESHESEIGNGRSKDNLEEHQVSLVIENEDGKSEKERTLFKKLKLSLFLNLSQCYLLLHDYDNAYHAANYALLLAPRNEKALFRQAKAIVCMENPGKYFELTFVNSCS
jgi:tetratricopeptide (TPR) repeat protein